MVAILWITVRLNDKVWLYWNEDLNQPVRFQRERNYKGYYMTGPEFFYLFEYIKCESSKDQSLLKHHKKLEFLRVI